MASQTLNLSVSFPWWVKPMIRLAAFAVRLGIPVPLFAMIEMVKRNMKVQAA